MNTLSASLLLVILTGGAEVVDTKELLGSGLFLRSEQFAAQQKDLTLFGKRVRNPKRGAAVQENVTIRISAKGYGRVDIETLDGQGRKVSCEAAISRPDQTILLKSNTCNGDWMFAGEDATLAHFPKPETDPAYRLSSRRFMGANSHVSAINLLGHYLTASNITFTKLDTDVWRGMKVRRLEGQASTGGDPSRLMQKLTFFIHTASPAAAVGVRFEHLSGRGPTQEPFQEFYYHFPNGEMREYGLPAKVSYYEGPTPDKLVLVESVEYSKISREPIEPAVFEFSAFNLKDPGRPAAEPSGWWLLVGFIVLLAVLGGLALLFFRAARRRKARQATG
jgi:hypothetical protein